MRDMFLMFLMININLKSFDKMVLLLDIIVKHILIYLFVYTVFSLPYCSIMYNTH